MAGSASLSARIERELVDLEKPLKDSPMPRDHRVNNNVFGLAVRVRRRGRVSPELVDGRP